MIKQKMSEAMLTMVSSATGRITYKNRNQVNGGNQAAIQTTALHWVYQTIYKNLQARYQSTQNWIAKVAENYFNEQIMIADEIIRESSRLYPYNFSGSPQAFTVMANSYRQQRGQHQLSGATHNPAPLSSVCRVIPLDKHRCELLISAPAEALRVNIYDEVNNLILSEQIPGKENFSRIYDLKWTKAAAISLEVVGKDGIFRTGQL